MSCTAFFRTLPLLVVSAAAPACALGVGTPDGAQPTDSVDAEAMLRDGPSSALGPTGRDGSPPWTGYDAATSPSPEASPVGDTGSRPPGEDGAVVPADSGALDASNPPPPNDAGAPETSGPPPPTDSGTTGACADPSTPAGCHACSSGATCQPNGCYNGYLCNTTTNRCRPPTSCP